MSNGVKHIRKLLGFTRKDLAKALNVTEMCIGNYENNTRDPSVKIAYKLVDLASSKKIDIHLEDIFPRTKYFF